LHVKPYAECAVHQQERDTSVGLYTYPYIAMCKVRRYQDGGMNATQCMKTLTHRMRASSDWRDAPGQTRPNKLPYATRTPTLGVVCTVVCTCARRVAWTTTFLHDLCRVVCSAIRKSLIVFDGLSDGSALARMQPRMTARVRH